MLGDDDSIDSHVRDTQDAGAGLVDEHTARFIAQHSAEAISWLVARGVPFSADVRVDADVPGHDDRPVGTEVGVVLPTDGSVLVPADRHP